MAKWVWPAAAGAVTSATGVAINLATNLGASPSAWVAVVLLTATGVVIAVRVQSQAHAPRDPRPDVRNRVRTVHGGVVQAATVQSPVTVHVPTTINQSAIAREGSTIYQAGRDVRRNT